MPARTDATFRNRTDPDHHKMDTPLEKLPIDMIKSIPVSDSLHLLDLGIIKRLLTGYVYGTLGLKTKWSANVTKMVSDFLLRCRMPSEIHRAVRGLDCLKFWKGTEYRTFGLYLGPVILKDYLSEEIYQHFMLFFCGIVICYSRSYSNYLHVADKLLKTFIERYIEIYGINSISSNVHNLCHLVDEVKDFGDLSTFNTYPFENCLQKIKKLLRMGNKPLSQVARRIFEINNLKQTENYNNKNFPILKNKNSGNDCDQSIYKHFFYKVELMDGLTLTNEDRNKWFLTKKNEIIGMKNATIFENKIYIFGSCLKEVGNFFETPIASSYLNIFSANRKEYLPKWYDIKDIKCKLVAVEHHKNVIFFPLIHTIDLCSKSNVV